jgi:NAD(P)-dependent dehydrogenase (short-subunit alcohol dehydrogenase family)
MRQFEGKTALVTGDTRGIGLAITRALHQEGASVGPHDRVARALMEHSASHPKILTAARAATSG